MNTVHAIIGSALLAASRLNDEDLNQIQVATQMAQWGGRPNFDIWINSQDALVNRILERGVTQ